MTDLEKRLDWIEARTDEHVNDEGQRSIVMVLIEIARQLAQIANRLEFADLDAPPWQPETGTFPLVDEEKKKSK